MLSPLSNKCNNNSFSKTYNEGLDEESNANLLIPKPLKMNNLFSPEPNMEYVLEIGSKDKKSFNSLKHQGTATHVFQNRDKSPADVSPNLPDAFLYECVNESYATKKGEQKGDPKKDNQEKSKPKNLRRGSNSSSKMKPVKRRLSEDINKSGPQKKIVKEKTEDLPKLKGKDEEASKSKKKNIPNSLKVNNLVRKACEKLMFLTPLRNIRNLSLPQEQIINDRACFEKRKFIFADPEEKEILRKRKRNNLFKHIIDLIPIIDPLGRLKNVWNIIMCLLIAWNFFAIPLQISFQFNILGVLIPVENRFQLKVLSCLQLLLFYLDILITMNTAYFEVGHYVFERKRILKTYFSKFFFIDFVSIIPLTLQTALLFYNPPHDENIVLLSFMTIFYLRSTKLKHYWDLILEYHQIGWHSECLISLSVLCYKILLLIHILACFWYMIGSSPGFERTWITNMSDIDRKWYSLYFNCLLWSASCLFTAGFNSKIKIENDGEVLLGTLMILLGGLNVSYVLFSVGSIFTNLSKHSLNVKYDFTLLKKFMRQENFNIEMQLKVQEYLRNVWEKEEQESLHRVLEMVQSLSPTLRDEFMIKTNGKILDKYPIFQRNFSKSFLKKLVFYLHKKTVFPEEFIFQRDEHEFTIYFLEKGKVEISFSNEYGSHFNQISLLNPGQYFGEMGFFTGRRRVLNARSVEFSTLYYIKQDEFLDLLNDFPQDYQRFCYLRDQLILYDEISILRKECYACNSREHFVTNCPSVHFVPDRDFLIKKINYPSFQSRKKFKRKNERSQSAYIYIPKLLEDFERHFERPSIYFEQIAEERTVYEEEEDMEEEQPEEMESNAYGTLLPAPVYPLNNGTHKTNPSHTSFSQTFKTYNSIKELNQSNTKMSELKQKEKDSPLLPHEKRQGMGGGHDHSEKKLRKHSFELAVPKLEKSKTDNNTEIFDAVRQREIPKNISPSLFELVNNEDPEEFEERMIRITEKRDHQGMEEELSEISNHPEWQKINDNKSIVEKSIYSKSGFSGEMKSVGSSVKQRTLGSGQSIYKKRSLGSGISGSLGKGEKEHFHMFYPLFEKMMNFTHYSPHNNSEYVLLKLEKTFETKTKSFRRASISTRNHKSQREGESAKNSKKSLNNRSAKGKISVHSFKSGVQN